MKITVAASKGGVGKTTTAVHLAAVLAAEGITVTLVDADPQGSAAEWLDARPIAGITVVEAPTARLLRRELAEDREGVVVVDTAPGAPDLQAIAIGDAAAVIVPTRPGGQEPPAVAATLAAIPAGTPRGILICAAPTGEVATSETIEGWTEAGETILGTIPRRAAIAAGPAGPLSSDGIVAYREVLDRVLNLAEGGDQA